MCSIAEASLIARRTLLLENIGTNIGMTNIGMYSIAEASLIARETYSETVTVTEAEAEADTEDTEEPVLDWGDMLEEDKKDMIKNGWTPDEGEVIIYRDMEKEELDEIRQVDEVLDMIEMEIEAEYALELEYILHMLDNECMVIDEDGDEVNVGFKDLKFEYHKTGKILYQSHTSYDETFPSLE